MTRQAKQGAHIQLPGKGKSPRKRPSESSNTAGKARSPHTAAGKGKSPRKRPSESSNIAGKAGMEIPASETPFAIKDAVLRELIGMGKVNVVTRSSKLSRFWKVMLVVVTVCIQVFFTVKIHILK